MFIEQAVTSPRHIEVQVLGDSAGNVVTSTSATAVWRHQKVVERAPAPDLDPAVPRCDVRRRGRVRARDRLPGSQWHGPMSSSSAPDGHYVFIEMNPRIQVEHTVTEEVTDIDLVAHSSGCRRCDAARTGHHPGPDPAARVRRPVPRHHRRPGKRVPSRYRHHHHLPVARRRGCASTAGPTQGGDHRVFRLDARQGHVPRQDPRRGTDSGPAGTASSASGVSTNIEFLLSLLSDEEFAAGAVTTGFIAEHPELLCQPPLRRPMGAPAGFSPMSRSTGVRTPGDGHPAAGEAGGARIVCSGDGQS